MSGKQKKGLELPDKSREIIGNRLLDLIFAMIFFAIGYILTGAAAGLQTGESIPLQYYCGAVCAAVPIPARLILKSRGQKNRILIAVIYLFAGIAGGFIFTMTWH